MTPGSFLWYLCGIVLATVLSISGQSTSHTNNILQYKAPSSLWSLQGQAILNRPQKGIGKKLFFYPRINQQDQYPYHQGYVPGINQYQDSTKLGVQQPFQHDFSQTTRNIAYGDEPKWRPQPVDLTASSNYQPTYYPVHSNQDSTFGENVKLAGKLRNLANVLSRNPRPDSSRSYEPRASASEVHEEVCAPPEPQNPPQNHPSVSPQPMPQSPQQTPLCSSNQKCPCPQPQLPPPAPSKPQSSQTVTTKPPYTEPKHELNNAQPPRPAPKFTPSKNPFQSDQPPKSNLISVSPLHSSSKHADAPSPESPCASPPCPRKSAHEYEVIDEPASKQGVPIIPAPKPVVHNPFSETKNERILPPPNPKGVLHHRQIVEEHIGYPDGYVSKPETSPTIPQAPYYVYPYQFQTVAGNPYMHSIYPYVPPPITKPIPLVIPVNEGNEEESEEVAYPVREGSSRHVERPSRRYDDDWSKDVLRDIADKLGAILDDDFRTRRFSSRAHPDNERGYSDYYDRPEDEPRPYARGYRNSFEEDFDNSPRKERKYSRAWS